MIDQVCIVDDMEKSVKLLGITLDNKLSWDQHMNIVYIRLSRVIYLLKCLKTKWPKNFEKMHIMLFLIVLLVMVPYLGQWY